MVVLNSTVATYSGLRHHYPSLGLLQNLPFLPSLPTVLPRAISSFFCSSQIFHQCPDSLRIKVKNLKCLLWSLEGALPLMTLHSTHTSLIWTVFAPSTPQSFSAQWISCYSSNKPITVPSQASQTCCIFCFNAVPRDIHNVSLSCLFQKFFEMAPVWCSLYYHFVKIINLPLFPGTSYITCLYFIFSLHFPYLLVYNFLYVFYQNVSFMYTSIFFFYLIFLHIPALRAVPGTQ